MLNWAFKNYYLFLIDIENLIWAWSKSNQLASLSLAQEMWRRSLAKSCSSRWGAYLVLEYFGSKSYFVIFIYLMPTPLFCLLFVNVFWIWPFFFYKYIFACYSSCYSTQSCTVGIFLESKFCFLFLQNLSRVWCCLFGFNWLPSVSFGLP